MAKQVFIVHGFEGNPHGNWFDSLSERITAHGSQAVSLAMPNPNNPTATEWQAALDQAVGTPNEHTFLVGHSLGCITLLHFLSRRQPEKLGGLVLAAGFANPLPPLPKLNGYIHDATPDFDALRRIRMPKHCLISDNDTHVPPPLTLSMAARLDSPITHIPNGGHLMASDGFTDLPQAWDALKEMLDNTR